MSGHLYVATDLRSSVLPWLPGAAPPACIWVRFASETGGGALTGAAPPADVLCYLLTPTLYHELTRQVSTPTFTLASLAPEKRVAALERWDRIEGWATASGWASEWQSAGEGERLPAAPVPLWLLQDLEKTVKEDHP